MMTYKTTELAERKARDGNAPVFVYRWDHVDEGLFGVPAAHHGGEIPFIFRMLEQSEAVGMVTAPARRNRPEELALQDRVSDAWICFAHEGKP